MATHLLDCQRQLTGPSLLSDPLTAQLLKGGQAHKSLQPLPDAGQDQLRAVGQLILVGRDEARVETKVGSIDGNGWSGHGDAWLEG